MPKVDYVEVDDLEQHHDTVPQDDDEALDVIEPTETEARAARMGHAPKSAWRGDPDNWIDAEEFIRRGEERMPVMRERLRKQDGQIASLQESLNGVIKAQGNYERETRKSMQDEFDKRQREAVAEADTDAYDQAGKERREWEDSQKTPDAAPTVDPDYPAWAGDNPWYGTNDKMTRFANALGPGIREDHPEGISSVDFFEEVTQMTRRQFPDAFKNANRDRPGAVEGSRGVAGSTGKKTYADLPQAAKRKCDEYIERGDLPDKDAYVSAYFEEL